MAFSPQPSRGGIWRPLSLPRVPLAAGDQRAPEPGPTGARWVGWCIAQLFFNALLATMVAVLPDQVPSAQRGLISGVLGVCTPIGSVCGTFLVKLFAGSLVVMFLAPCAIGGLFVLLFTVILNDRRLVGSDKPKWSLREFASTFYVNPRNNPDFSWAFASRFMFAMAYAFLVLRHHRSVRHPAREAGPLSLRVGSPAPAGPVGRRKMRMTAHKAAGPPWEGPAALPTRLDGDVLVGERRAGRGHFSHDRGGPEALHDQPDAERELPRSHRDHRKSGEPGQG